MNIFSASTLATLTALAVGVVSGLAQAFLWPGIPSVIPRVDSNGNIFITADQFDPLVDDFVGYFGASDSLHQAGLELPLLPSVVIGNQIFDAAQFSFVTSSALWNADNVSLPVFPINLGFNEYLSWRPFSSVGTPIPPIWFCNQKPVPGRIARCLDQPSFEATGGNVVFYDPNELGVFLPTNSVEYVTAATVPEPNLVVGLAFLGLLLGAGGAIAKRRG